MNVEVFHVSSSCLNCSSVYFIPLALGTLTVVRTPPVIEGSSEWGSMEGCAQKVVFEWRSEVW